ncbi:MAG: phenylacetate--CoA ligase family protein, partial [Thermodesulfobacteriota bacterium]
MLLFDKVKKLNFYVNLANPFLDRKICICRSFGGKVNEQYDFLEDSQWWSTEELIEYQSKKLRKLISHAHRNVPYYRETFSRNGIRPEDITTVEDLARVPILTKNIIRENFPEKIIVGNSEGRRDAVWTTGGSTGEPLKFITDKPANDFGWASFFRFFRWHGYEWGDRVSIFFRPFSLNDGQPWTNRYLDKLKKYIIPNVKYYDGSCLKDSDLACVIEDLIKNNTRILRGYPSSLTRLAEYCRDNGVIIRPKFVTTTGETLFGRQRKILEEQFQCKVFDQYGCTEIIGVSFECGCEQGLHIASEHCIVEVVDKDGNILPPGHKGMLLLTDLDNYRMPFIRYMVGDEGSLKDEICRCGRK